MIPATLPVLAARPTVPGWDAVIVDLDGTLVDTLSDFEAALNLMLETLGLPSVQPSEVERMVGKGSEHLVRSTLVHVAPLQTDGERETLFPRAMAAYQAHYQAVNGLHSRLYPGVYEGLQALHRAGLPMACLTNKPTAFARPLLAQKGLADFFGVVFGGDAFERKKPDPLPLLKTCEAMRSVPGRTLMVGDSSNDALAARAAGCPVALVTYGYNHGLPAGEVDADVHLDTLADLPAWMSL